MIRTLFSMLVLFLSFLFTVPMHSQQLRETAHGPHGERFEHFKAERRAAHKRMQIKASPKTSNYDIKYLRLEWNVDPASDPVSISGKVTTYWEAVEAMNTIAFDLAENLNVSQVMQRSESLDFTHNGHELVVTLPATQDARVLDSMTITYGGEPISTGWDSFVQETHDGIPVMWTLSEPYGARDWWPCKQDLTDKADSIDVFVTHPRFYDIHEYKTASNGMLVSETVKDSIKTSHWKHGYPIPAYLIGIAVTNYSVYYDYAYEGTDDEFPIINYVYPESLADARTQTAITADIMEIFGELFGMYPYADEKYGHAEFNWGGGMEHTTMSFMGGFPWWLIAHELAHQWFGDKITCGSWEDIWLNEGFGTYAEALVTERINGNEAFIFWKEFKVNVITGESDGSVRCTDTTDISRIFDWRLTYQKAAMVLHMLRYKLGDNDFFAAIQNYMADPELAFGFARTNDLQKHLEAQSGIDLDEFFADWYAGEGHPSYQLRWYQSGDSAYFLIQQTQSHPSVSFFEMPVPVRVVGSAGESQWLRLENTENEQLFVETVSFPITSVQFDPESELISRGNRVTYTSCLSKKEAPTLSDLDTLSLPLWIRVTSCTDGMIYLVPEDTEKDIAAIEGASIDSVLAKAYTPVRIYLDGMENGLYWLFVRDSSDNISEPEAFTIKGVGIENAHSEEIRIYPNPSSKILNIFTVNSELHSIEINSLNGQLIYSGEMEGSSHQIDLSSFTEGVYFITIRSNDLVTTRKIIKQ